ncbi:hypothetical protein ZIOFF_032310 [Zingiber officinale]|uniref:Protein kinase domain-containing protein n=1 Tax=Zingiber officinale TaxID=94328 RepID=A0A8J5LBI2_ZINOF|nr:hypothetical protein ZIOFF_032310 [Zingiber officinale]
MSGFLMLLISLLRLASNHTGMHMAINQVISPRNSLKPWNLTPLGPAPSPVLSPKHHGSHVRHHWSKHHRRLPPAPSPASVIPEQSQGCDEISCSEPLTSTPIGSPCGCVYPMQVGIDLGVAPFELFSRIAELEVEVAAGTFLKQSQVRIMGATASIKDPEKTTVSIDLVPLGEKFDKTSALLTYQRFWQKKVPVNMSLFGEYDVLYVRYPDCLQFALQSHCNRSILSSSLASSMSMSFVSTMPTCPPSVRAFSVSELEKATDKFSSRKVLGKGGFGRVYHGVMDDGTEVAVKLLTKEDQSGDREFIAEVETLSRLHHRNLVKLIGICIEDRIRCLVYEFVRNGSVESHLHRMYLPGPEKMKQPLDWDSRMKIALGAARGLAYLHEDSTPCIIHRDFKASNILLEDDFTPRVSDFGLAREASEGVHHISTQVMGTFGYVAPEYAMTGHLLVKSDVYSYGVVLLELLSGRKPVYISQSQGPENLVTWARPLLTTTEGLEQLVDPLLGGKYNFDNMAKVAAIASMCVHTEASQRPFMGEVVQALKLICNDMDEACDNSVSHREESLGTDCDFKGDFDSESSWWNGTTMPCLTYGGATSFVTMEYSSGPVEEIQRPHSAFNMISGLEVLVRPNRSGPLRTKRMKQPFHRLRGSMSDHGHPYCAPRP